MKYESPAKGKPRVSGVIVTYRPTHDDLLLLVDTILPQVDKLFIVNNGNVSELPNNLQQSNTKLISLGENHGIAYAQNIGIREALADGSHFVLLLDQDSVPAADMVVRLVEAYEQLVAQGIQVAAIGPSYLDHRQGEIAPFVYRDGFRLKRQHRNTDAQVSETDFLIASGCLIARNAFSDIGMMEEGLFIDYVDIEWGLRAKKLGYRNFGVHEAMMSHSLGDEWIKFRGRRVPVHSPLRHYYHIRNAIWLARRSWIGWPWRVILVQRIILQFLFFSVFAHQRLEHVRKMSLGFWHGLVGKTGRL